LSESENTHAGSKEYNTLIDTETTSLLLGQSNAAFNTEMTDIIVGVLIYSFGRIFYDRQPPAVFLEGHGREPKDDAEIHISETVGWFTTMYPIQLPEEAAHAMLDSVKFAKDIRRSFPGKGRPYFAYRYHNASGREAHKSHGVPELSLNYTGVYQQLESREGLFQLEDRSGGSGRSLSMSPDTQRLGLIEVMIRVANGCIGISFGFHQNMRHQSRLVQWADQFARELKIAAVSLASRPPQVTTSDFPLLGLSNNQLDHFLGKVLDDACVSKGAVEDLYPCSPLQEGILLSIQKQTASYANYFIWHCTIRDSAIISPTKLQAAWRSVVAHHSILSTVFVDLPGEGRFIQVLLRRFTPRIYVEVTNSQLPVEVLRGKSRPSYAAGEPNHAFTICQDMDGQTACRLDVNHALIDAASVSILIKDLTRAYRGENLSSTAPFSHFVKKLTSMHESTNIDFWAHSLANMKICKFPTRSDSKALLTPPKRANGQIAVPRSVLSALHPFCQEREITRSVFIQVAWALVLSQFTGLKDICFGSMVSSRDLRIKGVENMVGPLINMLICRINLDKPRAGILEAIYKQSVERLEFQHVPVARIQHKLGFGAEAMFNTALTVRESRQSKEHQTEEIVFREVESEDPDEV
jgi:non-ribosomal peptide synthase protein (TIGR01720 family)